MQDMVIKTRAVQQHRPLTTNENWGFEADLIAGAVRLIRTKILKACSDKLLILLVFENSGYQSHGQEPWPRDKSIHKHTARPSAQIKWCFHPSECYQQINPQCPGMYKSSFQDCMSTAILQCPSKKSTWKHIIAAGCNCPYFLLLDTAVKAVLSAKRNHVQQEKRL